VSTICLGSTGWGRSELAVELYDEILFNGATFGDLDRGKGPLIMASATDISTGSRFVFNQRIFDVICSDLNAVPLSRAASASSAYLNQQPTTRQWPAAPPLWEAADPEHDPAADPLLPYAPAFAFDQRITW